MNFLFFHHGPGRPGPLRRRGPTQLPKTIRKTLISTGIILILILVGGIAYTWYTDTHTAQHPIQSTIPADSIPSFAKPVQPAANARVGASVELITSPIAPGSNASITVRTLAGALCKISVVYKNVASKDSGLVDKTADEYGTAMWTWSVEKTVPLGTWPVNVTCSRNGKSGYVRGDLQIVPASQVPQQ